MKVLALDTTTRAGSEAIVIDDVIVEERRGDDGRSHGERLPGELIALAGRRGLALVDFDLFAVASGPGSFTGLRIGIATMQGLAFVAGKRMVAVSALEAMAHVAGAALDPGAIVGAWMDAYRREVFAALYRVTDAEPFDPARMIELDPPRVGAATAVLEAWHASPGLQPGALVGDGAEVYADVIRRSVPSAQIRPASLLAGAIGRLALAHARRGHSVDPAGIQPLYVRRPDAEIARENASDRSAKGLSR